MRGHMKRSFLWIGIILIYMLAGCVSSPEKQKEYIFFPIHLGYFTNEYAEDITFDPETNTFSDVPESATIALYKSNAMETYKKAVCENELFFLTTKKQEITKFNPGTEDLLVMKTAFIEGSGSWASMLFMYSEESTAHKYYKNIYFDMNSIEGDYLETSFAIMLVNTGNTTINTIYIADIMPDYIEINGEIEYAKKDILIPLNIEIAALEKIEHKVMKEDDKLIVVYHVIPTSAGIEPGRCVEIVVPIKVPLSTLMQDENKVLD
jgi:hypothetical protein